MTNSLAGKRVLFGVCGGIAAFKAAGWVSTLRQEGAMVTVVMTAAGSRFVTPLTFAALSGNRVHMDMFDLHQVEQIPHITLARDSDLVLVAPTTAQTLARLANGMADDLLAAIILATSSPVLLCPAMNTRMYEHPATRRNLERLKEYGYHVMEPDCGPMACGEEGPGRLPPWEHVREALTGLLTPQDLRGLSVLVTAGPTQEPVDPARFISNRSTGQMGYALARTARRRGATVVLISGPTALADPWAIETIRVTSAAEMHRAVLARWQQSQVVVKAAAVADFRAKEVSGHKVKKNSASLLLALERTADILQELGACRKEAKLPLLVGFAAESRNHLVEGRRKLREKKLDLIVVNDILGQDTGFGTVTNQVTLLDRTGSEEQLELTTKEECANRIWDKVVRMLKDHELRVAGHGLGVGNSQG